MQMFNSLLAIWTIVDNNPVSSFVDTFDFGNLINFEHNVAQNLLIMLFGLQLRNNYARYSVETIFYFGDYENMHWSLRINIIKRIDLKIFLGELLYRPHRLLSF